MADVAVQHSAENVVVEVDRPAVTVELTAGMQGPKGDVGAPGADSDMLKATYDPQSIAADAFARANHTGTLALDQGGTGATTVAGARRNLNIADFDTRADVASAPIGAAQVGLSTAGFSSFGDGGAALYKRVALEPAHAGKVQSADGAWWELVEGVVTFEMFGAVGDGIADDTTALQNTLDFGQPIQGRRGATYKITQFLTVPAHTDLRGNGATLDMSAISVGGKFGLVAAGSLVTGSALAANGTERSYTITVGDGSLYAVDEDVLLSSDGVYAYAGYNANKGEYKRVRSIATNDITFTTPLNDTYLSGTAADSARLRKVNWVDGVKIRGLNIVGSGSPTSGERGISLQYCRDFLVEEVSLDGQQTYQIEVSACLRGKVLDCMLNGVFYDGVSGSTFYGIAILDSSTDIIVDNGFGLRNRHLVVTSARGAGQGFYGEPCDITVTNCHQKDSMAGGAGRSWAYEVHGFGRDVKFIGCTADGCRTGWKLENAPGCIISACTVRNYDHEAVMIGDNGLSNRNITIDLITDGYTGNLTSSAAAVVRFLPSAGATFRNIRVNLRASRARNPANSHGIGYYVPAGDYRDVVLSGEVDAGVDDANDTAARAFAGAHHVTFDGLTTVGFRTGVRVDACDDCVVRRGRYRRNSAAATTGWGVYNDGTRTRIQYNEAENLAIAYRMGTTSADALVTENVARACTTNFSDAGTLTVSRNNDAL